MNDDEPIDAHADEIRDGRADEEAIANGTWAPERRPGEPIPVVESIDDLSF